MSEDLEQKILGRGPESLDAAISPFFIREGVIFVDEQMIDAAVHALQENTVQITIGALDATLESSLGSGGSKNVYAINVSGKPYALALPNALDTSARAVDKWREALNEPLMTSRLREIGFYTNTLSEVISVHINQVSFPAIIMRRYRDLPFEVRDYKNSSSSIGNTRLFPPGSSHEAVADLILSLASDIKHLLEHHVRLGRDSINLCLAQGKPRLFLNDLGTARFQPFSPAEQTRAAQFYAEVTIGAIVNGITRKEYEEYNEHLETHRERLADQLCTKVLSEEL